MTHTTSLRLALAVLCTLVAAGCHAHSSATPAANRLPPGVTMAMIAQGDTIFNTKSCKNCHGPNGVGGPRAPDLTDQTWIHINGEYDAIVKLVTTGFTKADLKNLDYPFSMNPRGGVGLTDDQIRAVAAYVWSLSHASPH